MDDTGAAISEIHRSGGVFYAIDTVTPNVVEGEREIRWTRVREVDPVKARDELARERIRRPDLEWVAREIEVKVTDLAW